MKMWDQVQGVQKKIAPIISNATDGVNLICYSQGKCIILLCTCMCMINSMNHKSVIATNSQYEK